MPKFLLIFTSPIYLVLSIKKGKSKSKFFPDLSPNIQVKHHYFAWITRENFLKIKKSILSLVDKYSSFCGVIMKNMFKSLALFTLFALEATAAPTKQDVQKVENYLNSIKTLSANFVQIASNGEKAEGRIYIEKPNKIRMEYNPPSNILIVGNGDYIVYYDKELEQITNIDYADIPAAMILANTVKLNSKELKVTDFYQDPGITRVSLQYQNAGDLGPFTLVFSNSPFDLKQWKVITPQSLEVSLSLYNTVTDGTLNDTLFTFNKTETQKKNNRFKRK
jgi:outer membrane lipoprotein-sorting protein